MAEKYIVCSGKGGSGKSTVTVGLAAALASAGKRVLCADADISVRSLDLLLETGEDILLIGMTPLRQLQKKTPFTIHYIRAFRFCRPQKARKSLHTTNFMSLYSL
mgnify:CR=1 FL=1